MLTEHELGNDQEIEAARLAEALSALDAGVEPDIDPREDPELSLLVGLSRAMRDDAAAVTNDHAFRSYRHRSRAFVLHTLESEGLIEGARPQPAVLSFRQRALSLAPIATAAAAAMFAIAVLVGGTGDGGDTGTGLVAATIAPGSEASAGALGPAQPNQTALMAGEEISRIRAALDEVDASVTSGAVVSEAVLRQITASTTALANEIEANPTEIDSAMVAEYVLAADTSRAALSRVPIAPGAESALAAAQAAAEDGVVTATRYFQDQEPDKSDGNAPAEGKDDVPVIEGQPGGSTGTGSTGSGGTGNGGAGNGGAGASNGGAADGAGTTKPTDPIDPDKALR